MVVALYANKRYTTTVRAVARSVLQNGRVYVGEQSPQEVFEIRESGLNEPRYKIYSSICPSKPTSTSEPLLSGSPTTVLCDSSLRKSIDSRYGSNGAGAPTGHAGASYPTTPSAISLTVFGALGLLVIIAIVLFCIMIVLR